MSPRDTLLAVLVTIIWGVSFPVMRIALDEFTPGQLVALRFLIGALPIFFLPLPKTHWLTVIVIGLTLFAGHFLLLFLSFRFGMPPGLASVTQQSQVFFTVLFAAIFLGERPGSRQYFGIAVAFAGVGLIGLSIGADLTALGLTLALTAAMLWGAGNVMTKSVKEPSILPLISWASAVAPLPALVFAAFEPGPPLWLALQRISVVGILCLIHLGLFATTIAFGLWGFLLQRYPASIVAPFSLLVPCTGILSTVLILGESFGLLRSAGMVLILLGLAVIVFPARRFRSRPDV